MIYILKLLVVILITHAHPLEPLRAQSVEGVSTPSGMTFCSTTGTLFMVSDKLEIGERLYNSIYELSVSGKFLQQWTIVNHFDLEGITCDNENQLLHIVEAESMRVTSFGIPHMDDPKTYFPRNGKNHLMEVNSFSVDLAEFQDTPLGARGLGDLTWNPTTQEFLLSNARPALFISTGSAGVVTQITNAPDVGDISGLAYDDELKMLWILSDAKNIFVTDLSGGLVYGSWSLPLRHGEGIALDNQADPPRLFVVTSVHDQHEATLFEFQKPDVSSPGSAHQESRESLVIVVALAGAVLLVSTTAALIAVFLLRGDDKKDPATEMLCVTQA